MRSTSIKLLSTLSLLLLLIVNPAWALSLDEAKSQSLIGETPTGYLASVNSAPSNDIKQLVADINNKRRAAYQSSADNAGVKREVIEARIAQRLYKMAKKGTYLLSDSGQWYKK